LHAMPHDVAFHMPEPSRVSVFSMGGSPCRSIDGVVTGAAVKETCLAQLHVKRRSRALLHLVDTTPPTPIRTRTRTKPSKLELVRLPLAHNTLHAPRSTPDTLTPSHPHYRPICAETTHRPRCTTRAPTMTSSSL